MKWILLGVCFISFGNLFSQIPNLDYQAPWEKVVIELTDKEKLSFLEDQKSGLFYFLHDNGIFEDNLKNFHFLMLNNDSSLDFIYEGYGGSENKTTKFFLQNDEGIFQEIYEIVGSVYDIKQWSFFNPSFLIKILSHDPCFDCLGVYNLSSFYVYDSSFNNIETVSFTESTELPEQIDFDILFVIDNSSYYLRSSPRIVNDSSSHNTLRGNILAEYFQGVKGRALASKTDDTGRVWWFVILPAEPNKAAIFQFKDGYYLGWMSSQFLRKL